jgi:hypothetical protein
VTGYPRRVREFFEQALKIICHDLLLRLRPCLLHLGILARRLAGAGPIGFAIGLSGERPSLDTTTGNLRPSAGAATTVQRSGRSDRRNRPLRAGELRNARKRSIL